MVKVGLRENFVFPIQGTAEKKHGFYTTGRIKPIPLFKQLVEYLVGIIF